MMHIRSFPRAAAYLKASRYNLDDPTMTLYGWAVCLSEVWTDEELAAVGTVNFDTMTGEQLLPELERLLGERLNTAMSWEDVDSLKAFLGSRGVKVSNLKGADDYWHVASILWPFTVKRGERGDRAELLRRIRGMSKKQRKAAATNIAKVPAKWRAA